ncbi:hypothetical protein [Streptomyces sp. NPDC002845]
MPGPRRPPGDERSRVLRGLDQVGDDAPLPAVLTRLADEMRRTTEGTRSRH